MAVAGQIEGTNISPTTSEGKLGCDLGDAVNLSNLIVIIIAITGMTLSL